MFKCGLHQFFNAIRAANI